MMEEKLQALTYLTASQERRIEALNEQLANKTTTIDKLTLEVEELAGTLEGKEQTIITQAETISSLTQALEEKDVEILEMGATEQDVLQVASDAEIGLRKEITKLEKERSELRERVKDCHKRLES